MAKKSTAKLSATQHSELLATLEARFLKNSKRHKGIEWKSVQQKLQANAAACWSLYQMEASGGEPDVTGMDKKTGEIIFTDCAAESPAGRRSLCYDEAALAARKEHKPAGSAMGMAEQMGIEMLDEEQYRALQQLGKFDTKTSSWLKTPEAIRQLDGSIFGDFRYGQVFIYHNGSQSYYAGRGFRGMLKV